jgi:response regulator of citrate/malate metabolism
MAQEKYASNLNLKWIFFKQQRFLSNPWWTRQLFDAEKEFKKLSGYFQHVSKLRRDNEKEAKEMDQVLCAMYLHETWANECMDGPTNDTFELINQLINFLEQNKEEFDRQGLGTE